MIIIELKIRKLLLNNKLYYTLLLVAIIYALIVVNIPLKSSININSSKIGGKVVNYKYKDNKLIITLDSKEKVLCTYYIKKNSLLNYYKKNLELGDYIKLEGKFNVPSKNTIPNLFNYRKYLYNQKILNTFKVESLIITKKNNNILYSIKNMIIKRINNNKIVNDYLMTFILGDKSLLDEDTFKNYQKNGVTHLFAISGMHVTLFSAIILSILKKLKMYETKRYIITISFIWLYAFLTAFTPSVLRAGLLFTLLAFNKIFYTEIKTINILYLTGTILVIHNPFIIKNIGFLYSYISTFGLIYSEKAMNKHKIIGSSLVANLFTLPITINNFYVFNPFSVFINLIFVPYVSCIIYPLCLLTFIFPPLKNILKILITILEIINKICSLTYKYKIIYPKLNIYIVIIYYIVLIIMINKKLKKCFIIIITILVMNIIVKNINNNIYITYLDVKQGDSTIIKTKNNVILIDTGGIKNYDYNKHRIIKSNISDNTINYMYSKGIYKLNYMILTHGDFDHMGEAINLVNNFKVEKVIFNCGPYNDLEKELIKVLDKKHIKYYSCIKELNIDKNKLYFLQTKEYDNENDNSNVIYTELNGYKFMFMGDASITTEKEILKKYNLNNIDILKVGHHGSKTSSSKEFIDKINPKYSVISVGVNNKFGHPNKEALNNLKDSKIYRTDQDGSIMFKIKNNKLKIETCKP